MLVTEEVTATPGEYYLIRPKSSELRKFVFDSPRTKLDSDEWRDWNISVDVLAARFVTQAQVDAKE